MVIAVACYREAYRQTLTIAAFDVPEKLAERGITGQVVAKALFDELIKRRELVTTLESGELKGAWAENRADVAIPEAVEKNFASANICFLSKNSHLTNLAFIL